MYESLKKAALHNRIKNVAQKALTQQTQTPGIMALLKKFTNKPKIVSIILVSIVIINFAACFYQIGERIAYYLSEPTAVDTLIEEQNTGRLPNVFLYPRTTKELNQYIKEISNLPEVKAKSEKYEIPIDNSECSNIFDHELLPFHMEFNRIMYYWHQRSYIRDIFITGTNMTLASEMQDAMIQPGAKISVVKEVPYGNPMFKLVIKLNPLKNCRTLLASVRTEEIPFYEHELNLEIVDSYLENLFMVSVQQHKLINTKKYPCSTQMLGLDGCILSCFTKRIIERWNLTCWFPLLSMRFYPLCNRTESLILRNHLRKLITFIKFEEFCNCPPRCTTTSLTTYTDTLMPHRKKLNPSIWLYVQSNQIRIVKERFAYDEIALLCDIGGNLGLYFGLSCLTIMEIFTYLGNYFLVQLKKLSKNKSYIDKKVKAIVKKKTKSENKTCITIPPCINCFTNEKKLILNFVSIALILVSTYQVYTRVDDYFDYPIYTSVRVARDKMIQFPSIVVCRDSVKVKVAKILLSRQLKVPCESLKLPDLLHPKSKYAYNTTQLWEDSTSVAKDSDLHSTLFENRINITGVSTVFGICTSFKINDQDYFPTANDGRFIYFLNGLPSCGGTYETFIIPENKRLHVKHLFLLNNDFAVTILFYRQTIIRQNTPKKPCVSAKEATDCEEKCFFEAMIKQNYTCSLPFMPSMTIPICTEPEEAMTTRRLYLESQFKRNPKANCSCQAPCKESLHHPHITAEIDSGDGVLLRYRIVSNIREIIEENLLFTEVKLLCDIGSIIGIMVGSSVLSVLEIFG